MPKGRSYELRKYLCRYYDSNDHFYLIPYSQQNPLQLYLNFHIYIDKTMVLNVPRGSNKVLRILLNELKTHHNLVL